MAFAAGMMVFPGGRVDPADGDPRLAARSNLVRAEAARRLGGFIDDETALAAHHAAIRELFEEAGILLAAGRTTAPDVLLREREALLAGSRGMADVVEALDLRLDARALTPIARWVTPAAYARRFDARFFAAELPAGGEPTFVGAEVAAHRWTTSDAALDAMAAGEIEMWIPTSSTLQRLRGIRTFDELRVRLALPASGWAAPSLDRLDDSLLRLTCWTAGCRVPIPSTPAVQTNSPNGPARPSSARPERSTTCPSRSLRCATQSRFPPATPNSGCG
jgi:8-oxo-dGTP pyrophosphatase MutT (NUDIX family)